MHDAGTCHVTCRLAEAAMPCQYPPAQAATLLFQRQRAFTFTTSMPLAHGRLLQAK